MAVDKLMNETQGDDIIDRLEEIADKIHDINYGLETSSDKVVSMSGYQKSTAATPGSISQGDTLNEAVGKLEKRIDGATQGPASSTDEHLVMFDGTSGKAVKDSGLTIADSDDGMADSDTQVPTSKNVKKYVDETATGISRYLGTIDALNELSTDAKKGDFYIVSTAWTGVHIKDEIIAEKNGPSQTIDGVNWKLLHNEENTDEKVAQSPVTTNADYEVLFSGSADNTAHTEGTGKDTGIKFNPSTDKLTVAGEISAASYSGLPEGNTTTKGIVQLGTDADKAASGNHGHGNITNGGALQTTDVDIASGDKLVITDHSDSDKVARASIGFDGLTETECLTKKGTFKAFNNYTHPDTAGYKHIPTNGATGNYLKYGGSSGTAAWAAPLTTWPATAAHTDTLPSTKLIADRFKTDETNILYAINNGVKNLGNFGSTGYKSDSGITYKYEDNIITITGTKTTADCFQNLTAITLEKNTDYVLSGTRSGSPNISIYLYGVKNGSPVYIGDLGGEGSKTVNSGNNDSWFLRITIGGSVNDSVNSTFTNPMLSLKSVYDQDSSYQPPALPNYDLTRLEAEDRAGLVECVDGGAKNLLQLAATTNTSVSGCHVTFIGTASASATQWYGVEFTVPASGSYVFAVTATSGTIPTTALYNITDDANVKLYDNGTGGNDTVYLQTGKRYKVGSYLHSGTSYNQQLDVMICTLADWNVSHKCVQYRPNWDLVSANAYGYRTTANSGTVAGVINDAKIACGLDDTKYHAGIVSVSSATDNEYLLVYFLYKYNTIGRGISIANNIITLSAINNLGTLAFTGGTAPYNIGIQFFY